MDTNQKINFRPHPEFSEYSDARLDAAQKELDEAIAVHFASVEKMLRLGWRLKLGSRCQESERVQNEKRGGRQLTTIDEKPVPRTTGFSKTVAGKTRRGDHNNEAHYQQTHHKVKRVTSG
jgi:hypothetical protein